MRPGACTPVHRQAPVGSNKPVFEYTLPSEWTDGIGRCIRVGYVGAGGGTVLRATWLPTSAGTGRKGQRDLRENGKGRETLKEAGHGADLVSQMGWKRLAVDVVLVVEGTVHLTKDFKVRHTVKECGAIHGVVYHIVLYAAHNYDLIVVGE